MFTVYNFDRTPAAYQYLCGLIQSERRNMERMEEAVVDVDYEALQHFISSSCGITVRYGSSRPRSGQFDWRHRPNGFDFG